MNENRLTQANRNSIKILFKRAELAAALGAWFNFQRTKINDTIDICARIIFEDVTEISEAYGFDNPLANRGSIKTDLAMRVKEVVDTRFTDPIPLQTVRARVLDTFTPRELKAALRRHAEQLGDHRESDVPFTMAKDHSKDVKPAEPKTNLRQVGFDRDE